MEYLLLFSFVVFACITAVVNIIKVREKNMERDYKTHCHVPPTAMKVKYIRGIPEIDKEIERRYSHVIKSAYTQFDESEYKRYLEKLEMGKPDNFRHTVKKIKHKLNDFRFTKNLNSVDSNILIYIFEKVGIIDFYFWTKEEKFYLADKHHLGIGCFSFDLGQVKCFCKKEQIENNEGRDENTTFLGIGLEDDTITFNRSSLPQHIKADGDTTILELVIDNKPYCGFFSKETYEILLNQIPQKELKVLKNKPSMETMTEEIQVKSNLEMNSSHVTVEIIENKDANDEVDEKIKMLQYLRDYDVLTSAEYEEKKKIVIEKVNKSKEFQ